MGCLRFEDLEVYQLAERLADEIWEIVSSWPVFARDTVGEQVVRAADSIGANIAEGTGRASYSDNKRFVGYARGSFVRDPALAPTSIPPETPEPVPRLLVEIDP